jgi:hypothetical protein
MEARRGPGTPAHVRAKGFLTEALFRDIFDIFDIFVIVPEDAPEATRMRGEVSTGAGRESTRGGA